MKNWETLEPDVVCLVGTHRYMKGRQGRRPTYMVLHHNAGVNTSEGLQAFWNTSRAASAHYQVETTGRIGQLVYDNDTAYHAANWEVNLSSIGVEVSNSAGPNQDWPISDKAIEEAAHLAAALHRYYKWGRPVWGKTINPHSKYASTSCPYHLNKGGKYHNRFMQRALYWYDVMAGVVTPQQQPNGPVAPPAAKATAGLRKVSHPMGQPNGKWKVSSGFGPRWGGHHNGLDFAAPIGTPIYAPADGVVIEGKDRAPGSVSGFGNWVWLDCQDSVGHDFIFGHMQHKDIYVRKGDRVTAGQLIARVGNEGQSTGPHCHFERWSPPGRLGGKPLDPAPWLADNLTKAREAEKKGLTVSEKQEIIAEIHAAEDRIKTYVADYIRGFVGPIGSDVKDVRQQLTNGRDRDEYPGWEQLGGRTVTDAIGVIGTVVGVPDMHDTLGKVVRVEPTNRKGK